MHPALSVIFFTTLSGAGYGLLFCSALAALLRWSNATALLVCMLLGLVLVTIGLLSSVAHLGRPARAWRAFSQWRSSWLSREGVMAVATYVPALALAALLVVVVAASHGDDAIPDGMRALVAIAALPLMVGSVATVICTAMIYASLTPIPAWRHRTVLPVYLLFAVFSGGLLCAAAVALLGEASNMAGLAGIVAAIALAAVKLRYWRDIDAPLPLTRGDAVGLPGRTVTTFERPHTQGNYLTREMGFVLARKHAWTLRLLALVLFAVVPILLLAPVWLLPHAEATLPLAVAAASVLLGAFVERWLFFAQARHMVMLYY